MGFSLNEFHELKKISDLEKRTERILKMPKGGFEGTSLCKLPQMVIKKVKSSSNNIYTTRNYNEISFIS